MALSDLFACAVRVVRSRTATMILAVLALAPACGSEAAGPAPKLALLAFNSDRQGSQDDIYVMDSSGGNVQNLTNNAAADYCPAWSPDGTRIAFVSDRDITSRIYVMNSDGTGVTRLTSVPARLESEPAWSPDGMKIAFTFFYYGVPDAEVYVMNADGTGVTNLTNNAAGDYGPAWSPDGAKLVFASTRDGDFEIYVMNADGTGVTRLTNNAASDVNPQWRP